MKLLERVAVVAVALVISVAVIALLSGGLLAGRDNPGVSGPSSPVGAQFRDLGNTVLAPRTTTTVTYDSEPPTSGAHHAVPIPRDGQTISDDQLLTALAAGNVVLLYGSRRPPPGLAALATSASAPFTPALAASGQAVILARRAGTNGVLGAAWTWLIHVRSPADPQLATFASNWLGHGAPASDTKTRHH